jgi:HAD superfamily hydrolase (TIGR01509 family)
MGDTVSVVAFDCDGVMFDTAESNRVFYNHILGHLRRSPLSDAQLAYVHMHTVDEAFRYLFGEGEELHEAYAFRSRIDYQPFLQHMDMEPDLVPLLDWLRPRFKTAVATNRTDTMDRVLRHYDLTARFDLVVTARDVPRPKPYPDGLNRILAVFGLAPDEMLYIGDSSLDAEAAASAGVRFAAYRNTALAAAHHLTRLGQVRALLQDR